MERSMNDALTRFRHSLMRQTIMEPPVTAAVTGSIDLPVSERDREWDGTAAKRRVLEACGDDAECISRAFLYQDTDADPATQAAWKLGFADIIDGTLTIVPLGVAATAGGRGVDVADVPEDEKESIRARITRLYDHIRDTYDDWPESPFQGDE
jgi:hypothetical protein